MYFDMSNSPATFQSYMNDIFEDPILKGWILVYMDDILVFAKAIEELNKRTEAVLDIMEEQGLHLKPEKCQFQKRQIEFLGSVISEKGVDTESGKVQAIVEWLPPKDLKGLQQFLGFANYYRTFIEGYSHIVTPLTNLTRKNVPFTWDERCDDAMGKLKMAFITKPILRIYDWKLPTVLETDASYYAMGAVLLQKQLDDDKWHPIAYRSQAFNGAERNYDVHDRELLSFVRAVQHWEHYLLGIPFEWHTDHRNLTYFMEKQDLTSRQHRWSQVISQYNYTPHHREGKKMYLTDPMSRQIQHKVGEADDEQNKQILVIDPDRIRYMSTQTVLLKEEDLLDRIRKCDKIDDSLKSAVETVRKNRVIAGKHGPADWAVENGILRYKGYI